MSKRRTIISAIVFIIIIVITVAAFLYGKSLMDNYYRAENSENTRFVAVETTYAGIITDKQCSNTTTSDTPQYLLTIRVDYMFENESCVAYRTFGVTEDIYNNYTIGDYFDAHGYTITR